MKDVEKFLDSHDIEYVLHEHSAHFSCEDSENDPVKVPGLPCKNLILRNKKKSRFFHVVLPAAKRADLKALGQLFGEKKLSFANEEILMDRLGVKPGSVSPFGLINDLEVSLEVFIDKDVMASELVNFHPNRNTASLEITTKMFQRYLDLLEHDIEFIEL